MIATYLRLQQFIHRFKTNFGRSWVQIFKAHKYKLNNQQMMLSRTRKQIRNIECFFKQAGIEGEIEFEQKNLFGLPHSKKDRVLIKKKEKQIQNKLEIRQNLDKLQSDVSQQTGKDQILLNNQSLSPTPPVEVYLGLEKILSKITIIGGGDSRMVQGIYGHTTAVFRRPIIEGRYYLQFKFVKAILNNLKAKINKPPSIRIGACPHNYSKNSPLGQGVSVGYKSSNGKVVNKGTQKMGGKQIKEDDVIGMELVFTPPHKYQNKEELWQGSHIIITKNGQKMCEINSLYQEFYCPAFSLYNYACLEVRYSKSVFEYCPKDFSSYSDIFTEDINYATLKNSNLFQN